MNQFSKFAAEFVFVATLLMIIIIVLFLGILIILFSERANRKKNNKELIDEVGKTNVLFQKILDKMNGK